MANSVTISCITDAMKCIDELFAAQAAQTPDAIAVCFNGESITYGALDQDSDTLAQHLQSLGVGPDVLVALYLERSFDMVTAMLAVLKAGGAYIPLDPIHPPQRLAYMLADTQPLVLLTQARLQARLPRHESHVVAIDAALPQVRALRPAAIQPRSPRDLAYVIYTSGSTGNPKGVQIEHRSVVNMLASMQQLPGLVADDTMLAITTLVFDIAVLEIFLPLTLGAKIVVAPSETARDGVALRTLVERSGVTVIQATPATLQMLLDAGWTGAPPIKILCGGEAWPEELARRLLPCCGSLWNMYGPTETTVWSAISKVTAGNPVTIGPPIARTSLYVLDGGRQPVPAGVPGELYIGGSGLARGYHGKPALTQERFLADPFRTETGGRMYRTGDEVLRLPDGTLKFLGRIDHQVSIRGFRIELGEIEAVLANYPGLAKAVVILREDQPGEKRLVAYFVGDMDFSAAALRAHLGKALPDYMVPTAYMRLQVLPLTPNGKLDRNALPPPSKIVHEPDGAFLRPGTPAEQEVAKIWCEMLNLRNVGLRDNFFDLGGHSLLALHVIGRINRVLQSVLTIPAFYREPTIEGLAKASQQSVGAARRAQVIALQTGHTGLPLYFIGAGPHEVRLARHIGENRSIFAVESPIPTGWHRGIAAADRAAMPTIEALGRRYGNSLIAELGTRPCVIAGYSFAGKIAFEAARVVQQAGGKVAFVMLIDASVHVGEEHTGIVFNRSLRWIWRNAFAAGADQGGSLAAMPGNYVRLLRWSCGRVPTVVKNLIDKVKNGVFTLPGPSGYFDENGVPIAEAVMIELNNRSGLAWQPRRLDAAGVLLRVAIPGEEKLPGYDAAKGWTALFARGLKVVHAAGDHMTMVRDENIVALARQIRAVLDQPEILRHPPVPRHGEEAETGFTPARPNDAYRLHGLS